MRYCLCTIGGEYALITVEGQPGETPIPPTHPRLQLLQSIITTLRQPQFNAGTLPGLLDAAFARGVWLFWLIARMTKWSHFDGEAEHLVRRFFRLCFRMSRELDYDLPRLLDQKDRLVNPYRNFPITAEEFFLDWGKHVVASWLGRWEPTLDFPTDADARSWFVNNP